MAGIQWGNPKIAVEKIPDPNIVDSTNKHMQKNESVVLEVKDVFIITGRGIVVTGIVENRVKLCEQVRIINPDNTIVYSEVKGIELDWKLFDEARRGDNVGLLLVGVRKSDVQRGAIIEKIIYMENNPLFQVYLSDLLRTIIQNVDYAKSERQFRVNGAAVPFPTAHQRRSLFIDFITLAHAYSVHSFQDGKNAFCQ